MSNDWMFYKFLRTKTGTDFKTYAQHLATLLFYFFFGIHQISFPSLSGAGKECHIITDSNPVIFLRDTSFEQIRTTWQAFSI